VTTFEHVYDGLEAMVAAADAGVAAGRVCDNVAMPASRSTFIGRAFTDWSDVKAKIGETWPEGLDEVQWMLFELRKATLPPITCQRRRPRFADAGDEVDLDRLRAGQECWRTTRRESVAGPQTFCLIADMGTPGSKDSMDVLWRGAVAIVLADLLEAQGHRVEVWSACRQAEAFRNGAGSFQAVCLKRADQPLDISTVTNAVSGWCYRTLFFQERAAEPRAWVNDGMGYPVPLTELAPAVATLVGNARPITVADVWSKADAVELATRTLETINT
jgi:hypothetical protein